MDAGVYATVIDQVSDGVYVVDTQRRITSWNRGAEQLTGYSAAEVIGRSCSEGILRHVNDEGRQLCLLGCPLAGVMNDGSTREAHVFLHHKAGHRVPVTVRGVAVRDDAGVIIGAIEVFTGRSGGTDAAQRKDADDASLDPVTGLPTRRVGERNLEMLMKAVVEDDMPLGILFLDADHFKDVNDTFGHRVGDAALRMVGQSLAHGLRRGDVPARWGGEELIALLPGVDPAGLAAVAERVRMLVENSWIQLGDQQVRVTVSVGATVALPTETADEVIDRADRLMYASKEAGRNTVTTDAGLLVACAEPPILGTDPVPVEIAPDRRAGERVGLRPAPPSYPAAASSSRTRGTTAVP